MSNLNHLHQLMQELGPVLEPESVSQSSDTDWGIVYDEHTIIELEYEPQGNQLALSCELGRPNADQELATLRHCLLYNYLWQDTSGVVLARSPEGSLIQLYRIPIADLDLQLLCTIIRNFADKAATWRDIITAGGLGPDDDPGNAAPEDFHPHTAIRA